MADTAHGIQWALERTCPIRKGENWTMPNIALAQTTPIHSVSQGIQDKRYEKEKI